ncbi:DUF881 domain-containing protein [bacterium LRH843]|nr:DUF881 domain-containing protein [bacterium LRH843]
MDKKLIFTFVTFLIGFMLAIQFHTTQEPVIRDTRDIRELRKELLAEQEKRQQLNTEVEKIEKVLSKYKKTMENRENDVIDVLSEQIEELKEKAGLKEKFGNGLVITIDSLNEDSFFGQTRRTPSPDVFRFLVNELNIYGAEDIAVENERIISISSFRDVNHITYLNSRRLPPLPIQVKVLTEKGDSLYNQMVVSDSVDYFEIEGFQVTFEKVNGMVLPAYDQTPRVRYMEEVKEG